jgi:ABC-2 type transport system permease protein
VQDKNSFKEGEKQVRYLSDIYWVFWRETKRFFRQKVRIFMILIQPIVWLTLIGNVFEKVARVPGFPAGSYLDFMAPGIVVMVTLFGGIWGGMTLVWDRRLGYLQKMLAVPIGRSAIVLGKMFAIAFQNLLQVSVILLIALAMGVKFSSGLAGFLILALMAILLCLAFSGISLSLGSVITSHETLIAVVNFLTLPVMFTSNAMMPLDMMPSWLEKVARLNPITYAVNPIRSLFLTGFDWGAIGKGVLFLFIISLIMTVITSQIFRRSVTV